MYVGFLPFIPKPVAEYSTMYTSMLNFVKVSNRLDPGILPLVCDEGFLGLFLTFTCRKKDEFCNIILMLGDFHTVKYVDHCIGKYIKGSSIEESLRQTQVFGVNVDVNIH